MKNNKWRQATQSIPMCDLDSWNVNSAHDRCLELIACDDKTSGKPKEYRITDMQFYGYYDPVYNDTQSGIYVNYEWRYTPPKQNLWTQVTIPESLTKYEELTLEEISNKILEDIKSQWKPDSMEVELLSVTLEKGLGDRWRHMSDYEYGFEIKYRYRPTKVNEDK